MNLSAFRLAAMAAVLLVALSSSVGLAAGSCRLGYKIKPGQVWQSKVDSQFRSSAMGVESTNSSNFSVRYRVMEGERKGWVKIEGRIVSHSSRSQGGVDYSKLAYTADMHTSGELRNIKHTGSAMPPIPEEQLAAMPPQYADMMRQSGEMMARAMQMGVFWFPELPEEKLTIGDSFEAVQKSDIGSSSMMQSQTVVKTEYTLEDVSQGLAYFAVRQRALSKTSGMGGSTDSKTAGKADAIFDLEQGMWVEMTMKSKTSSSYAGMGGMSGEMGGVNISRYRMHLK
ncbi:MAG: hypothetical protein K9M17_06700 [Mariprofundaceae bacterium]|nr:hypothetical protein [Mariprofundaceae bacterium]